MVVCAPSSVVLVRLHHPRVQREHAHPCACNTNTGPYGHLHAYCHVNNDMQTTLVMCATSPRNRLASERAKRTLASLLCP
ncbi:hypothetical protein EYF80_025943 [Liparis tanakae]|uniref:Uncharacterized protein n=1 Tax=Liparis tanakae TaxID=230148 RepID=A0A4Z2HEV1_9TELE|nr:hypothetical protein EYF80_025943 [Liparis tanakae]